MAEHNRFQQVWVLGDMEIDGNEAADQLVRQGLSHPLIWLQSTLSITAKVGGGWSGTGQVATLFRSIGSPHVVKGRLRAFLKKPSAKKVGELFNLSRNLLRKMTWQLTRHCQLKGHLFNLYPTNAPDPFKSASYKRTKPPAI